MIVFIWIATLASWATVAYGQNDPKSDQKRHDKTTAKRQNFFSRLIVRVTVKRPLNNRNDLEFTK